MKGKKLLQSVLSILLAGTAFTVDPVKLSAENAEFSMYHVSDETVYADENGSAVLEAGINAGGDDSTQNVELQWYEINQNDESEIILTGSTDLTLELNNITEYHWYRCIAVDETGNTEAIDYHVYPLAESEDSGFNLYSINGSYVSADKNGNAVLEVAVETWGSLKEEDISLQWYETEYYGDDEGTILTGETSKTLNLTGISDYCSYRCVGTDPSGITSEVNFSVSMYDPGFSINYGSESTLKADQNGNIDLEATVEVYGDTRVEDILLQWYKMNPFKQYEPGEKLDGETSSVLHLSNVTQYSLYRCIGTDPDGFTRQGDFYVYPWTESQEAISFDLYAYDGTTIKADENGTAQLKVDISVWDDDHGEEDISLQWYQVVNDEFVLLPGETGQVLVLNNVTEAGKYICIGTDNVSNTEYIYFHVYPWYEFTVTADGELERYVTPGGSETLHVNTDSEYPVHYEWTVSYISDDLSNGVQRKYEEIENDTDTLVLNNISKTQDVSVRAYTDTGDSQYINFKVIIENHLSVNNRNTVYIAPGEEKTIQAAYTADDKENIQFVWYVRDINIWNQEVIPDAHGPQLTIGPLTNGKQYTFNVIDKYMNFVEGYIDVLIDNNFSASAVGKTDRVLNVGDDVDLAVQVSGNDLSDVTYTWRLNWSYSEGYVYRTIEEATSDTYSITGFNDPADIECIVSDKYGNTEYIYFRLRIDNGFKAKAEENNIIADYGKPASLHVITEGNDLSKVTYTWYVIEDYDWKELDHHSDTLTIDSVTKHEQYRCDVDDGYGNAESLQFEVIVQNHLIAEQSFYSYRVDSGSDLTMEAIVSADDMTGITYTWSVSVQGSSRIVQEGEQSSYMMKDIQRACYVYCKVTDRFGNTKNINFRIDLNPDFTVIPEQRNFRILPGEEVTFKLNVSSETADLSQLTYRWYGYVDGEYWGSDSIVGEAGTSYKRTFNSSESVYCEVTGTNGAQVYITFSVIIENHLSVDAAKSDFLIESGESVTLEAIVSADDLSGIQYQWYKLVLSEYGGYTVDEIDGAVSSTYTLENIHENGQYQCEVTDRYGTTRSVDYRITIRPRFNAWAEQNRFTINPGEEVSLKVLVSSEKEDISKLTYTWYEADAYSSIRTEIPGETGPVLTAAYDKSKELTCIVKSPQGGERAVDFSVTIENHLVAFTEQSEYIVEKGDNLKLSVIVKADDMSDLRYKWSKIVYNETYGYYEEIERSDTKEPFYELKNINSNMEMRCRVQDKYGNIREVSFSINLNPHFTAKPEKEKYVISPGSEVSMKVITASDTIDLSTLTYTWKKYSYSVSDNNLNYQTITLEGKSPTLTEKIDTSCEYCCTVKSPDGATINVWFEVTIQNHFTAEAAVNPVRVKKGGSAELKINVSADDTSGMHFIWYGPQSIVDNDTNTLAINHVTENQVYYCNVIDKYNTSIEIRIDVQVYESSISLNQTTVDLAKGESMTLKAESNSAVTWTSSNTAVASVDKNGKVTGKSVGTATIKATNKEGDSAECIVNVYAKVTSVKLDKTSAEVRKGDTLQLTASVLPEDAKDKSVTWSSSDPAVAAVDNNGKVTAIKGGTAKITVKTNDGGYTAECTIKVLTPAESVSLNKTELALKKGESETLTTTVLPEEADDKTVTWTSSDASVAGVDANGKVTAVKSGTAVITVKTNDGGYTAECSVTVTTPVTGVSLDKTALTLFEEDTAVLKATVLPADADDPTVTWSSSDETIATVDSNGKVAAIAAGTAKITVTTKDANYTAECTVTVREKGSVIFVTGVELDKSELTLRVGKTETLTATVLPENAEDKSVTWSSSDPSVAKVDSNGKVTAVADTGIADPASAVITVTTNDGKYTASCTVTVEDPVNAFVRRLYLLCFGRKADSGGFNMWTSGLRTKKYTAAYVVQAFFTSNEMKNMKLPNEEWVERCYLVMMNRASDAGGKKGWVNKLDIGMSQTYVLRGFVGSTEFNNICKDYGVERGSVTISEPRDQNQGITEFVSRCYSEVLGRKADTGGLNTWCKKILTASNRKQAAIDMASNGFFHSAEYLKKNTTNDQYVRTLYRTFLGREADTGGYNSWMNKLKAGTSRDSVMKGFANSTEFANIMAKYGIK